MIAKRIFSGWEKIMPLCAAFIIFAIPQIAIRLTAKKILADIMYWISASKNIK